MFTCRYIITHLIYGVLGVNVTDVQSNVIFVVDPEGAANAVPPYTPPHFPSLPVTELKDSQTEQRLGKHGQDRMYCTNRILAIMPRITPIYTDTVLITCIKAVQVPKTL